MASKCLAYLHKLLAQRSFVLRATLAETEIADYWKQLILFCRLRNWGSGECNHRVKHTHTHTHTDLNIDYTKSR